MLNFVKRQRGVSLIEMMIGLVIIAILLGLSVPSFSNFIRNSQVRNAAESIQNGLNLARAEAVRRNTGVSFVLTQGSSWTVKCDALNNCGDIQTRGSAEGSSDAAVATSEADASGSAVADITFSSTLTFDGLGKVIAATLPIGNQAIFDVRNPAGGGTCGSDGGAVRCLRVMVSSGGQVRMCDPKLQQPDAQAC